MKTIVSIDITGKDAGTAMRLAAFCGANDLTFTLADGAPTRALTLADAAPVKAPVAAPAPARPRRVRKPKAAKAAPKAAAPKTPKAPREKAPRDRSIVVTPEEKARVIALVKKHNAGAGVRTEVLYAEMPGTRSHKQAILLTLRRDGILADNGLPRRSLAVFLPPTITAPFAEPAEKVVHKGQTLTKVRVRDAATKAPKRVIVHDVENSSAE